VGALVKRVAPSPVPHGTPTATRDVDVLASVAWAGFLTTAQVERLHFPSRRRAQRRLRVLFDHGLLRAHLQGESLHKDNVYTLTSRGLDLLVEHGRIEEDAVIRRLPRPGKLRHAVAIRDVFVALVLAEEEDVLDLEDFRFEEDLASEPVFKAAGLIPDAIVLERRDDDISATGIEVDLGTETRATLSAKCTAWARLLAHPAAVFGAARARLLFVAEREGRRSTIAKVLTDAQALAADVVLFADLRAHLRRSRPDPPAALHRRTERPGSPFVGPETERFSAPKGTAFRPLGGTSAPVSFRDGSRNAPGGPSHDRK
jgi:hypothetical protein